MSEEKDKKYDNPFKIPVSQTVNPIPKVEEKDEKPSISPEEKKSLKEDLEEESDDGSANTKTHLAKMSEILHLEYKMLCIGEGTTVQNDLFKFIKKRVRDSKKKNK